MRPRSFCRSEAAKTTDSDVSFGSLPRRQVLHLAHLQRHHHLELVERALLRVLKLLDLGLGLLEQSVDPLLLLHEHL